MRSKPNLVFLFADQMRAQATGYAGDPNVRTPYLDGLAGESVNFTTAVSSCPVCTPYRASLLTGRYPLTHGLFVNDVCLSNDAVSIAQAYKAAGYDTAYIGKWHIDGHGRSAPIPPERRQGFDHWEVLECTHDYNNSLYYAGDETTPRVWEGYDAFAQTRAAQAYLESRRGNDRPFVLFVSWGTPHNPYHTAPPEYLAQYDAESFVLRDNVPAASHDVAREQLTGYYAHITALDDCTRAIDEVLVRAGLDDDTVFVFTSDHGDSVMSHCPPDVGVNKQRPYDESVRVPFLLRWPAGLGRAPRELDFPFPPPDIMPTLLGLCGVDVPDTAEGADHSPAMRGESQETPDEALIACYWPFAGWCKARGGREYRGLRTRTHTYVRSLDGPWLLFDNEADPYQLDNLIGRAPELQADLEARLQALLDAQGDAFLPGTDYLAQWGYSIDRNDAVPFTK